MLACVHRARPPLQDVHGDSGEPYSTPQQRGRSIRWQGPSAGAPGPRPAPPARTSRPPSVCLRAHVTPPRAPAPPPAGAGHAIFLASSRFIHPLRSCPMGASPRFRGLIFLFQACLLLSCGSSIRSVLPPAPEELPRLALVIQEGPTGQVVHSWRPAAEFQEALRSLPSFSVRGNDPSMAAVLTRTCRRNCDQEHIACHQNCMRRKAVTIAGLPTMTAWRRRRPGP